MIRSALATVAFAFEILVSFSTVLLGIFGRHGHVLIPGASLRLALMLIMAWLLHRKRTWARWIIVAVEAFTATVAFLMFIVSIARPDSPRSLIIGALSVLCVYVMITIAIACGRILWIEEQKATAKIYPAPTH